MQAPYCLRTLWLHHIFWLYLINGTIFRKKVAVHKMCALISLLQLLFQTFLILTKEQPDTVINVKTSSCKVTVTFVGCNKTWIFWTDFRKSRNIKFHQNPSSGSRVVSCDRRTDGHDEANICFSQFYEHVYKLAVMSNLAFSVSMDGENSLAEENASTVCETCCTKSYLEAQYLTACAYTWRLLHLIQQVTRSYDQARIKMDVTY